MISGLLCAYVPRLDNKAGDSHLHVHPPHLPNDCTLKSTYPLSIIHYHIKTRVPTWNSTTVRIKDNRRGYITKFSEVFLDSSSSGANMLAAEENDGLVMTS